MIYLIILLFIFSDAAFNHKREREGNVINHWYNTGYRIVFGLLIAWGFELYKLSWQEMLYFSISAFFWFWLLFNLILNWFNVLPWDYLGTRALLDKLERKAPLPFLFLKVLCAPSFTYFFYVPNPYY